jgi:tetratricopeptide (TPR) repeat protein
MLVQYLRRPITLIGIFLLAALLIVATRPSASSGASAAPQQLWSSEALAGGPAGVDSGNVTAKGVAGTPATTGPAQVLVERGVRAFEIGRYDDAIILYRSALRQEPNSAIAYNLLGMAFRYRFSALHVPKDREREVEAFREAVRLDPNYVPALINLGVSLVSEGRGEEAVPLLNRALTLEPDHPDKLRLARMAAGDPP